MLCRCCCVSVVFIVFGDVLSIVFGLFDQELEFYGCEFQLSVFFNMFGIDWLYLGVMNSSVLVVLIDCLKCFVMFGKFVLQFWLYNGSLLILMNLNEKLVGVSEIMVCVSVWFVDV